MQYGELLILVKLQSSILILIKLMMESACSHAIKQLGKAKDSTLR